MSEHDTRMTLKNLQHEIDKLRARVKELEDVLEDETIPKTSEEIVKGIAETDDIPDYFCQDCGMPPHNCLCSHEEL